MPLGYTYRDGTAGGAAVSVYSYTINFDWDDEDLSLLMAKFFKVMGVKIPDEILLQAGMMNESKITGK